MGGVAEGHDYGELLENNRLWVDQRLAEDPGYFRRLAEGQRPAFLLIGCSDSRKPLNVITQTEPGELFIHRNVANQVGADDLNVQAVLDFAIGSLEVRHVIVCGHTRCGGVQAALDGSARGPVRRWLEPLEELRRSIAAELEALDEPEARADLLSARNVVAQVEAVAASPAYQSCRDRGAAPSLHGWLFRVETGLIEELELPMKHWRGRGLVD
ncbi:MAG: carbonic anhydrase [Gemmatimonadetes bacterium]|nr:carbonic anhydrase [Gemmatimonadota bacterium]